MTYLVVGIMLILLGTRVGYALANSETRTWKHRARKMRERFEGLEDQHENLYKHFRGALAAGKAALLSNDPKRAMKAKFDFLKYEEDVKPYLVDDD